MESNVLKAVEEISGYTPDEMIAMYNDYGRMAKEWEAYASAGLSPEVCAEYRKFEDEVVASGMTFGEVVELMHKERTRWIPISERLPNMCGFKCLVCAKNKFEQTHVFTAFTGYMERGKLEFHSCEPTHDDLSVWEITHWMPLPSAPNSEVANGN